MTNEREDAIRRTPFSDLDVSDPFFDSLRAAYNGKEFDRWFAKKAVSSESTWVVLDRDNGI